MTSRSLYFKLMKEDLKHRMWSMALLALAFFFAFPVAVSMIASERSGNPVSPERYYELVKNWMSVSNGLLIVIVLISALVCGISSFSYLHSAKQTDFYHSLPVSRGKLYIIHYIDGIVPFIVLYLAGVALGLVSAGFHGVASSEITGTAMRTWMLHGSFYLILYTTVVIAMMLTGNKIVAFLGTLVFGLYIPGVTVFIEAYRNEWFRTYYVPGESMLTKIGTRLSPLICYFVYIDQENVKFGNLLPVLAAAMLLAVLGAWIYNRRPSEAAGKAMAFAVTKPVIRCLLVTLCGLVGFKFFWNLNPSYGWGIFGWMSALLISHGIIEVIYSFDLKKMFSCWKQLFVCAAASGVIILAFVLDLTGFDRFIPQADQVDSVAVSFQNTDSWVSYGKPDFQDSSYYSWRWEGREDYVLHNMALTDLDSVLTLVQEGIAENESIPRGEPRGYYSDMEDGRYESFFVTYRMKSGKTVSRRYMADMEKVWDAYAAIYDSETFKEGNYPLLLQKAEDTAKVNFQVRDHVTTVPVTGDVAKTEELLAAYREDLRTLSAEELLTESPVATIQFMTKEQQTALTKNMTGEKNYYDYEYIGDRCYYPVYPSFANTWAELEKYEITLDSIAIDPAKISQIQLWSSDRDTEQMVIPAEQYAGLMKQLVYEDYAGMNVLRSFEIENYEVYYRYQGEEFNQYFKMVK